MVPIPSIENFGLLLGLTLFFGLAFEELNARGGPARPGGIRTFPLLGLTGALLFLLEPVHALPYSAGILVLGACLVVYYWRHIGEKDAEGRPNVTLALPFCNLLAYVLGPICLAAPPWIPVGVTVAVVLLLVEREQLHRFAWQLPMEEIVTAGKFLVLTGLILPLLPRVPVIPLISITPQQIWLAVLAVCTISYASYLLQRYVVRRNSALWIAILGGLYTSTATTVTLARNARKDPATAHGAQTGIVLATAVSYLRLLVIIAVFNIDLAVRLGPSLVGLFALGNVFTWVVHVTGGSDSTDVQEQSPPHNPLELTSALIFAALYVVVSVASAWVHGAFGPSGVFWLAGVVGFTDVTPFVLSLAQADATSLRIGTACTAILIAASSNSLLKALYAAMFAGLRTSARAIAALLALASIGIGLAFFA